MSDNSLFTIPGYLLKWGSNLEEKDVIFLFHNGKSLERLSFRNTKYTTGINLYSKEVAVDKDIPQNVLINICSEDWPEIQLLNWFDEIPSDSPFMKREDEDEDEDFFFIYEDAQYINIFLGKIVYIYNIL